PWGPPGMASFVRTHPTMSVGAEESTPKSFCLVMDSSLISIDAFCQPTRLLAPGVQHGEAADLGSEMLRVSSNVLEGLREGAKEQPIERARVLECQRPEVVRERKDHMTVGGLQELLFAGGEPRRLGRTVTFRAAAVAARVVRLLFVPTVVALGDMSAQGRGATQRDGAQGPVLLTRQGRPIAGQKGGAMLAHHLGDFQRRPTHGSRSRLAGKARASKGLSVAWSAGCATWR